MNTDFKIQKIKYLAELQLRQYKNKQMENKKKYKRKKDPMQDILQLGENYGIK
jgi:uncharacterized protein (DUF2461 family)